MSREIKFRAWHEGIQGKHGTPAQMLYDEKPGDCLVWKNQGQNISSVMQYTGLKDKNGKEIYEGDILQMFWNKKKHEPCGDPFVVSWNETQARFTDWSPRENMELIGNIYQNPELIKE